MVGRPLVSSTEALSNDLVEPAHAAIRLLLLSGRRRTPWRATFVHMRPDDR